jgi:hypothetical protein
LRTGHRWQAARPNATSADCVRDRASTCQNEEEKNNFFFVFVKPRVSGIDFFFSFFSLGLRKEEEKKKTLKNNKT